MIQPKPQPLQQKLQHFSVTGEKAFITWLNLAFKDGEKIWFKFSHNRFFTGTVNHAGTFPIWSTKGDGTSRGRAKEHKDGYGYLSKLAARADGGVFYIPGKPTEYPLKEYCLASDDIGAEMDDGTAQEQWERIELLVQLSGLTPGYIIGSGGKSAHPHWKLTVGVPIAQRTFFARCCAIALLGDPAVTNPHQPMRVPGFFRREKGKEQTLEFYSEARYSPEDFEQGMQRCFAALGFTWRNIEEFSQDRWQEVRRVLSGKLPRAEKEVSIRHLLALPESELPENVRRRERQQNRSVRRTGFIGTANSLIDAVNQASEKLGSDAFDWVGHNWQWTGNKARGYCPWHESTTGTAGWIAPLQNGNGWGFACPTCTDNKQLSAFAYHWHLKNGLGASYPKGKEWIASAKEFCQSAGVVVPELPKQEYIGESEENWGFPELRRIYHNSEGEEDWEEGLDRYFNAKKLETFLGKTLKQVKKFVSQAPKHLGVKGFEEKAPSKADDSGVINFKKGDRAKVVSQLALKAKEEGRKLRILDNSETGSGKSYQWGEMPNELLGVDKLFYVSPTHRNPSTSTVEKNFGDLPVRHDGLLADKDKPQTALGNAHVRWAKKDLGEQPNITPNCKNTKLFHIFSTKGYHEFTNASAGTNPICGKCKFAVGCAGVKDQDGDYIMEPVEGYTYRKERQEALKLYDKIRASFDSLPSIATMQEPTEEGKPGIKVGVVVDEFHAQYTPTNLTQVSLAEFDSTWMHLLTSDRLLAKRLEVTQWALDQKQSQLADCSKGKQAEILKKEIAQLVAEYQYLKELLQLLPAALETVKPIVYNIRRVLSGGEINVTQETFYGWNELQLREVIGELPEGLQEAAEVLAAVKPSLEALLDGVEADSVSQQGIQGSAKDKKGSTQALKYIRSAFNQEASKEKRDRIKSLPANSIVPILKTLAGERGSFRVKHGTLEVVTPNDRHKEQLLAADLAVVLDATLTPQSLAQSLGIDPSEILVICEERKSYNNLTIKHVRGLGKLTRGRSKELQGRLDALLSTLEEKHPEFAVIDHLATKRAGDGHWFNDSRGTNAYQHKEALTTIGSPYQDIGSLAMVYSTTTGDKNATRGNPKFDFYVQEFKESEVIQAGGRLRAHRRPDEQLTWYVVTDENIDYLKSAFPGATFEEVSAFSVTPNAGSEGERTFGAMLSAIAELAQEKGRKKVTQAEIAAAANITQSTVSKHFEKNELVAKIGGWAGFRKLFQALLSIPRGWNNLSKKLKEEFGEDALFAIETYLPLVLKDNEQDMGNLASECANMAQTVGWKAIQAFLHLMPMSSRVNMLSFLIGLLSDDWRQEFLNLMPIA